MALKIPAVPTRINLPKEFPTAAEDCPEYIKLLVQALNKQNDLISNSMTGMQGADVLANRPAPGIKGRTYYATDNGHFYTDDGTNWITLV